MRIGVIADTHIPAMGNEPPPEVALAFAGVDRIFHAGHAYTSDCIEWLARIAPVDWTESSVAGGGEAPTRTSRAMVLDIEGHKIGLTHELLLMSLGDDLLPGAIGRHYPADASLPAELAAIFGEQVDIVVFGYTHEAMVEEHQGVLLVNPGSPSLIGQQLRLGTVAMLEIEPGSRDAWVIDLTGFAASSL